jgi:hypothetical protein
MEWAVTLREEPGRERLVGEQGGVGLVIAHRDADQREQAAADLPYRLATHLDAGARNSLEQATHSCILASGPGDTRG